MLAPLLKKDAVSFDVLHARYGGLLELVRMLIGVVPNCDPYLEIWPPAFRTYNVMVPNLLNLPPLVWGFGAPRDVVGLAMYASSRTAGCMYCSAHTCSFALRRGALPEKLARAMDADLSTYSPGERAAIESARALADVPARFTRDLRRDLEGHFGRANAEWIALSVGMMGFLNKFMDAIGVELEGSTVEEVRDVVGPSGWTPGKHLDGGAGPGRRFIQPDDGWTRVRVLKYAPSALALDRRWTAGVPNRWPAAGDYLRERTGHAFPMLANVGPRRVVRALATMLRDNLDPAASEVGVSRKLAAGAVFATTVGSAPLAEAIASLGPSEPTPAVDALARAIAPSPARVDESVTAACAELTPAAIVEVVTFVSLLQLLHRVGSYYAAG